MMQGLTAAQANMLAFLRSSERTPSYAEMGRHLGLASKSSVHRIINALEERGFIERLPNKSRAVRLIAEPKAWSCDPDLSVFTSAALLAELKRRGVRVPA